jgi:hypothetical protein
MRAGVTRMTRSFNGSIVPCVLINCRAEIAMQSVDATSFVIITVGPCELFHGSY